MCETTHTTILRRSDCDGQKPIVSHEHQTLVSEQTAGVAPRPLTRTLKSGLIETLKAIINLIQGNQGCYEFGKTDSQLLHILVTHATGCTRIVVRAGAGPDTARKVVKAFRLDLLVVSNSYIGY